MPGRYVEVPILEAARLLGVHSDTIRRAIARDEYSWRWDDDAKQRRRLVTVFLDDDPAVMSPSEPMHKLKHEPEHRQNTAHASEPMQEDDRVARLEDEVAWLRERLEIAQRGEQELRVLLLQARQTALPAAPLDVTPEPMHPAPEPMQPVTDEEPQQKHEPEHMQRRSWWTRLQKLWREWDSYG